MLGYKSPRVITCGEAASIVDPVSGTAPLSSASYTVLLLQRDSRQETEARIKKVSNDSEEVIRVTGRAANQNVG